MTTGQFSNNVILDIPVEDRRLHSGSSQFGGVFPLLVGHMPPFPCEVSWDARAGMIPRRDVSGVAEGLRLLVLNLGRSSERREGILRAGEPHIFSH